MTLTEALHEFDSVRMDREHPVPMCCGLPVIMTGRDGVTKIYCMKCECTVTNTHRDQWVITNWGTKGITFGQALRAVL